ncbi:MAG: hypothetical protein RMJ44_11345 [Cytophagales bacterium]|nr:hypothetical protein [Bernardetiaceae bacterium]MDW8211670.1 hypothetical protein [Cytophagales bacterium]
MKNKIAFLLILSGLLVKEVFAAAPLGPLAAQVQQVEQAVQAIEAAPPASKERQLFKKAEEKIKQLVHKWQQAKKPTADLKGLFQTLGIILIIVGLVGIILGVLGIGGGYPAGGGALFLGLVLYLIARFAL